MMFWFEWRRQASVARICRSMIGMNGSGIGSSLRLLWVTSLRGGAWRRGRGLRDWGGEVWGAGGPNFSVEKVFRAGEANRTSSGKGGYEGETLTADSHRIMRC